MHDFSGRVEAIFTAAAAGLPMVRRRQVMAQPGVGLEGDRYAAGTGYWSRDRNVSRDLTLVEAEAIEQLIDAIGCPIGPDALRRNVVTRGIHLNDLVGIRFRIGPVLVQGTRLCKPCDYLARLVGLPILQPLVDRGGLRADILGAGELAEGVDIHPFRASRLSSTLPAGGGRHV